jgi:putative toxin-antitoxin system antitoxin component (TIGR02293 family)
MEQKAENQLLLDTIPVYLRAADVLTLISSGVVNSSYLAALKNLTNFSDEIISNWLNINVKTYRSYKKPKTAIKADIQEHTVMLLALMKHGIEVFGSNEELEKWLQAENFQLGKTKPIDYLNTISGIKFIDDRLTGMEYGDNA